ncbi:PA0069 family radical SAM protein [Lichenicoccus roseus]|uniref:PA0069 family radical SAM protein n=1 Tax=Lichenicoccus roseus TaxID=2683649 RepID=A0A5R9J719_9PROT|nr:PA0069 family radical SAM protein [Lichenicoccus roseus]TLU73362.1 PA0069 family radical SAM protein [Lichenicoccus roseus]
MQRNLDAEPEAGPQSDAVPALRRGRGVSDNVGNRFDRYGSAPFDDGWESIAAESLAPPSIPTSLTRDASRSAISWNESPDLGFDRAVNVYRGCEHGCVYCYARPSHAYLGLSPGLDFESRLTFKPDIARLLERELRRPGYVANTMQLGSNTDPYQPVERTLALTRAVLEVLERFGHPVTIVTKSAGVLRDTDILARMAGRGLVRVWLSVTTLDPELARRMEPRAATPQRRLAAIAGLHAAGVPAGVLAAPMIPGLNDAELERILEAAAAAGATDASYVLLRLPLELRQMFETWLHQHYPQRARHVLNLVRETRAGALNDSRFGHRFRGQGVYADMLAQRFRRIAGKLGLTGRQPLDSSQFLVPIDPAAASRVRAAVPAQMALF